MNCNEFESIVPDLARQPLVDALVRDQAQAHCGVCPGCARRLADERSLTSGLRALNLTMANDQASPQVESELLSAFRRQNVRAIPERTTSPSRSRRAMLVRAGFAAAAAIALLLSLAALYMKTRPGPNRTVGQTTTPNQKPVDDSIGHVAPANTPVVDHPDNSPAPKKKNKPRNGRRDWDKRYDHLMASNSQEATEFFPLNASANLTPLESGAIVRVELPWRDLLTLGLPVSPSVRTDTVPADVVVGQDGIARAIRLVR